jgi:hypothetical protein
MEQEGGDNGLNCLGHVNLANSIRTLHKKSLSPKTLESLCIEYSAKNVHQMVDWHESLNLRKFLNKYYITKSEYKFNLYIIFMYQ